MKTTLRNLAAACLMGTVLLAGNAFATGTQLGKIQFANGSVPSSKDVTFVAFINGSDDVIHTENAYNSALGLSQGYVVKDNQAFWLVNFSNFSEAKAGDQFQIQFTSGNERAEVAGVVPGNLTETSNVVSLRNAVTPLVPANVITQRTANGVEVTWNAEPNVSYRVYRSDLPSGAHNTSSRGIYDKVAENVNGGSFVDTNTNPGQTYWYVVIAENKNGVFSGHSAEAKAAPATQFVSKPQLSKPANQLHKSNGLVKLEGESNGLRPAQPLN